MLAFFCVHLKFNPTSTTAVVAAVQRQPVDSRLSADYGNRFLPATAQRRRSSTEPLVDVRQAGAKGMGVFALQPIRAGRWVCQYVGTLLAEDISGPFGDPLGLVAENEDVARSARTPSDYVFELTAGLSIDAINSTHFSRFINHAERCNMEASVSVEERRVGAR